MKYLALLPLLALPASAFQREMAPDRPDTTESAYTVEAERFQIESTFWSFTKDGSAENWTLGETNFKFGLTPSADLQLVLTPWIHDQADGSTAEGFGDVVVRMKYNLWGNDGGSTAAAIMPYVSIPTGTAVSSGEWEGGIILPVAIELNEVFGLSFQIETAHAWNDDRGNYDWVIGHTIALGFSVSDEVGAFIEYVGNAGGGSYDASCRSGLTWAVSENLQWDLAVGVGLSDAADDFSIAQGVTFRF